MGVALDDLLTLTTKEDARAQLLNAAAGLGWAQNSGDGNGTVALSGTPNGSYDIRLQIVSVSTGSALTFKYSLDAGATWSTSVATSGGAFVLPATGLTVTFTAPQTDSFRVGDTYTVASFAPPLPTTSWAAFSVPRILVEVFAVAFSAILTVIRKIASGGLIDYASGGWLTLHADQVYGTERKDGVPAQGLLTVTDTAGSGPWTLTAGVALFQTTGGLRYRASSTTVLPQNGTVSVPVIAEAIGTDYNQPAGAITVLGTPLPGVTVTNGSTWLTVEGTADETDTELRARAKSRWSTLAPALTSDGYAYWAKLASTSVTRAFARVSPTVPGQVDLYLAGSAAPVSPTEASVVQAALEPRVPLTSTLNAQPAVEHPFTLTGTVNHFAAYGSTIGQAIDDAVQALFRTIDVGGTVYLSQVVDTIQDVPGVRNVNLTGLTDTALAATEVATLAADPHTTLTLVPV
jgi:uncharacterized phage protein gp47/JayE